MRGKVSGDLYVRVVVETPEKLSSKQKKSIQEAFQDSEKEVGLILEPVVKLTF